MISGVAKVGGLWPFRGTVVWLTLEQGGRVSGPPAPPAGEDYASTAFVPPRSVDEGLASFVLRGFQPGAWRSTAQARWLVPENIGDQGVKTGTVVVVTEGPRVVGYFHVEEVLTQP
jgi:hypothetical protein